MKLHFYTTELIEYKGKGFLFIGKIDQYVSQPHPYASTRPNEERK